MGNKFKQAGLISREMFLKSKIVVEQGAVLL
jgi:hypothetical protein